MTLFLEVATWIPTLGIKHLNFCMQSISFTFAFLPLESNIYINPNKGAFYMDIHYTSEYPWLYISTDSLWLPILKCSHDWNSLPSSWVALDLKKIYLFLFSLLVVTLEISCIDFNVYAVIKLTALHHKNIICSLCRCLN